MRASNLKLKSYESEAETAKPGRKETRKAKVVSLFRAATKAKKETLSAQARENLIVNYQIKARKMAFSILRRWHARLDLQEVHSVVDLSLCEAVRRFNPTKGASFMTFLFYHLRGNLIRAVATAAKLNAVPFADFDSNTAHEDGEGVRTLANGGVSANEVASALTSQDCPQPDEVLMKKELVKASLKACDKLDSLEREVLMRIFLQEEQLLDVAASLGYSRCHISRVKRRALESLYSEVKREMGGDDTMFGPGPSGDEDESQDVRRVVHRRKPRSGKSSRSGAQTAHSAVERLQRANMIVEAYA